MSDWFKRLRRAISIVPQPNAVDEIIEQSTYRWPTYTITTTLHCPHCGERLTHLDQRHEIKQEARSE